MATAQPKMTVAEKLETALEFKDVGNSAYKEGNFKAAAKNYHKAILYLKVRFKKYFPEVTSQNVQMKL